MPDAPDDFEYSNVGEFVANLDSSELAARLYSPMLYARKGQALYISDISRGLAGFSAVGDSAYGEIRIVSKEYSQSGLAIYLKNSSSNPNYGTITNAIPLVVARYYTIDVRYEISGTNPIARVTCSVAIDGELNTVIFRHTYTPTKIELYDTDHGFVDVTSLSDRTLNLSGREHLSLTFDTEDRVYREMFLSGNEFTIANMDVNKYDDGIAEEITFSIAAEGDDSNIASVYVSAVILSASDE